MAGGTAVESFNAAAYTSTIHAKQGDLGQFPIFASPCL
jgi:hypothetical protein